MRSWLRSRIGSTGEEAGLTIVEVVVAALSWRWGRWRPSACSAPRPKNTQRAKATQVALNRAQQEIESLRSLENEAAGADRRSSPLDQRAQPQLPGQQRHLRVDQRNPRAATRHGRQRRQPLRRRLRRRRRCRPRSYALHQRRRQRQRLPLRRLARRRELPRRHLPGHPGLQADRRRGEARHARQPIRREGLRRSAVGLRRPDRQRRTTTRFPGAERESSPRSSSTSPTRPARRAGRPRAKRSPATTCSTTRSAPAPAGCRPGRKSARPTRCCSAGRPIPTRSTKPTRRSTTTPTTSTWSQPRYRQGRADPPRRHQRLPLQPDRDHQPRVPGPPLGHRSDGIGLQNDRKGDARVLHPDAQRSLLQRPRSASTSSNATKPAPRRSPPTRC